MGQSDISPGKTEDKGGIQVKVSCRIIEDLLPLYADDVCSSESRRLVEEHIAECPECSKKLNMMKDTSDIKDDIRPLKSVGKWLEKLRLKALLKGIINGILFMAVVIFGYFFLTEFTFMKVPADRVTVSDVCMLSDGNIAFHMYVDDKYDLNAISAKVDSNGNMYIIPQRSIIENRRIRDFDSGLFNMYYGVDIHELLPDGEYEANPYLDFFFTYGDKPNAVYLRLRGEDILIWEKGMELPAASEQLEEQFFSPNWEGNG